MRIVPRNVESQHELTSFVSIIVHINRVDKRVDDTPLILNIFNITPLERFEPIHDSLLRQEGLFHFLPGNLPFEVSAFFFQLLKTFLRCWCDNAILDRRMKAKAAGDKQMLETQGVEAVLNFCQCNAFKYLYRAKRKNGLEDMKKAVWYLNKYIELKEGHNYDETTVGEMAGSQTE